MLGRLRPELAARVAVVARTAAEMGVEAWLVGGTVRDLLLGRDGPDLDFVVVGDGAGLAAALQRELGGRLLLHAEFLTADLIDGEGVHLDLATARQESYAAVAALPDVWPAATLDDDLRRRDFTVNAMALRLPSSLPGSSPASLPASLPAADNGLDLGGLEAYAGLADPAGGRRDLAAGALRVLHARSFLDDPTRVLRGVRFEVRLGLRLTPETEALVRQAVAAGAFARLSGSRLRRELELLLGADAGDVPATALAGLERLQELGVLGATVHPRLAASAEWPVAWRRLLDAAAELAWYRAAGVAHAAGAAHAARAAHAAGAHAAGARAAGPRRPVRPWLLLLLALAAGLDEDERDELAARLLPAGEERRLLTGCGGRRTAALSRLGAGARPHEVDAVLAGLADEELLLLAAQGGALARSWVRRYLTELRPLALAIRGADLLAAGAPGGPAIGGALRATRDARLDGEIGPGDELAFALARARDAAGGSGAAGR
jgi:tRNA nucleotidyltransferase (CCA-adding enzyme)